MTDLQTFQVLKFRIIWYAFRYVSGHSRTFIIYTEILAPPRNVSGRSKHHAIFIDKITPLQKNPLRHKSHHHKSFWGPPRPRGPRHCAQLIRLSCSRVAWYFHHGAAPCFRISRHRVISFSRDYQAITSYPVIKHRNSTSMNNQTR